MRPPLLHRESPAAFAATGRCVVAACAAPTVGSQPSAATC